MLADASYLWLVAILAVSDVHASPEQSDNVGSRKARAQALKAKRVIFGQLAQGLRMPVECVPPVIRPFVVAQPLLTSSGALPSLPLTEAEVGAMTTTTTSTSSFMTFPPLSPMSTHKSLSNYTFPLLSGGAPPAIVSTTSSAQPMPFISTPVTIPPLSDFSSQLASSRTEKVLSPSTITASASFPYPSSAAYCGETIYVSDIQPYRTQSNKNYNGTALPWFLVPHTGLLWLVDRSSYLVHRTPLFNINSTHVITATIVNAQYVSGGQTFSSPVFVPASSTVIEQACQSGVPNCGYGVPALAPTPAYLTQGILAPTQTFNCQFLKTIEIGDNPFPTAAFLDKRTCILGARLVYDNFNKTHMLNDNFVSTSGGSGIALPLQTQGFYQSYAGCTVTETFISSMSLANCPPLVGGGFNLPLYDPRALKTHLFDVPTIQLQQVAPTPGPDSGAASTGDLSNAGARAAVPAPAPAALPVAAPVATTAPPSSFGNTGSSGRGSISGGSSKGENIDSGAVAAPPVVNDKLAPTSGGSSAGSGPVAVPVGSDAQGPGTGSPGGLVNTGSSGTAGNAGNTGRTGNAGNTGNAGITGNTGQVDQGNQIGTVSNGASQSGASSADPQVNGVDTGSGSSPLEAVANGLAPGSSASSGSSGAIVALSNADAGSPIGGTLSNNQNTGINAQALPPVGAVPLNTNVASSVGGAASAAAQALSAAGVTAAPEVQRINSIDAAGAVSALQTASSQLASAASTATGTALSSIRAAQSSVADALSSIGSVVATASVSAARVATNAQGVRLTTIGLVAATAVTVRTAVITNSAGAVTTSLVTEAVTDFEGAQATLSTPTRAATSTSRAGAVGQHSSSGSHLSHALGGLLLAGAGFFL